MKAVNKLDQATRYAPVAIGLHWLMLFLIATVYAAMEFRDIFPKGSALRDDMKTWHYMLGLSVLVLVVLRLLIRLTHTEPPIQPEPPPWQNVLAKLVHLALYALMVGLPVAGWLTLSAKGDLIPFFGLQLPPLIAASKANAQWIKEIHEVGATIGYFLIGLHAAAALFHHYYVRDNTLLRMLPKRAQ